MSVSKVQICNLALSAIGSKAQIQSIDELSTEAKVCKLHYNQALATALVDADWSFATTTAGSAVLTDDPPGDWTYMHAEPANCLRIIEIVKTLGRTTPPLPFKRHVHDGQRVVLSDTETPIWRYVYDNTDPALYSPQFSAALVLQLATRLAMPITRKKDIRDDMSQQYRLAKMTASITDAKENSANGEPEKTVEWISDRA